MYGPNQPSGISLAGFESLPGIFLIYVTPSRRKPSTWYSFSGYISLFRPGIREHPEHGKLFDITDPCKLRAECKPVTLKKQQAAFFAYGMPEVLYGLQDYRLCKNSGMSIGKGPGVPAHLNFEIASWKAVLTSAQAFSAPVLRSSHASSPAVFNSCNFVLASFCFRCKASMVL